MCVQDQYRADAGTSLGAHAVLGGGGTLMEHTAGRGGRTKASSSFASPPSATRSASSSSIALVETGSGACVECGGTTAAEECTRTPWRPAPACLQLVGTYLCVACRDGVFRITAASASYSSLFFRTPLAASRSSLAVTMAASLCPILSSAPRCERATSASEISQR